MVSVADGRLEERRAMRDKGGNAGTTMVKLIPLRDVPEIVLDQNNDYMYQCCWGGIDSQIHLGKLVPKWRIPLV